MRLLWLSPEVPEPGGRGGAIRSFHQVRRLLERGWEVTVVSPSYPEQAQRAQTLAALGARLALVPRPPGRPREALTAAARDPRLALTPLRDPWLVWQADVFWRAIGPAAVREADGADAVIVEHDFCARWATHLPEQLPAGLVFHNATWVYDAQRGARLEARRFARHVRRVLPRYGWTCAVSEADAAAVRALGGSSPALVPNGTDARAFADLEPPGPADGPLLFVGTLDYAPNAEAVRWFAERVRRPLTVVGRGGDALRALPGVTLRGWVDDLAGEYARAAAVVAPLRTGGGTNMKVVEALAAGRPLIATPVAVRGIPVQDGVHARVADTPEAFAAAVDAALADREAAAAMAARGRELAGRYDWDALGDRLHDELERWLCTSR